MSIGRHDPLKKEKAFLERAQAYLITLSMHLNLNIDHKILLNDKSNLLSGNFQTCDFPAVDMITSKFRVYSLNNHPDKFFLNEKINDEQKNIYLASFSEITTAKDFLKNNHQEILQCLQKINVLSRRDKTMELSPDGFKRFEESRKAVQYTLEKTVLGQRSKSMPTSKTDYSSVKSKNLSPKSSASKSFNIFPKNKRFSSSEWHESLRESFEFLYRNFDKDFEIHLKKIELLKTLKNNDSANQVLGIIENTITKESFPITYKFISENGLTSARISSPSSLIRTVQQDNALIKELKNIFLTELTRATPKVFFTNEKLTKQQLYELMKNNIYRELIELNSLIQEAEIQADAEVKAITKEIKKNPYICKHFMKLLFFKSLPTHQDGWLAKAVELAPPPPLDFLKEDLSAASYKKA